ncbi:unnamed protein product [Didymodactylos carnosus]|uniref:E3 ubiquitin-protein ligase HUWE1 n=1 Tax=Didymodactylos carnosus TaxID=1234261 RepID=A0A8S2NRH0_9BILA|nr:unnamed protein product [Didymodactylos carnosus]CAF4015898.1 unnamed protein product [Didymodactylos carnosus]
MLQAIRQALTGNHGGSIGVPPGCPGSHEPHVLLRILGPAMSRSPDVFIDVASNVMQLFSSPGRSGATNRLTNQLITNDDHVNIVPSVSLSNGVYALQARPATSAPNKPQSTNAVSGTPSNAQLSTTSMVVPPSTTTNQTGSVGELAERLLVDLLDFLLTNDDDGTTTSIEVASSAAMSTGDPLPQLPTSDTIQVEHTDSTVSKSDVHIQYPKPRRLLSKSTVLRILAELIRSYANVAKLISTKTFSLKNTPDTSCSALSYILDNLLPGTNQTLIDQDKDTPALCRLFLVAMAACNHCLESQMNLVNEVKLSLTKAISLPECDEKHVRLQSLSSIINTMIESCPAPNTSANQPPNQGGQHRVPQLIINNMIKIMYKRGLINDLAKMIHSIELSSPKLVETVNAVLKPMETLSRTINYASSLHVPAARPHNRHTTTSTMTSLPSTQQTNTVDITTTANSNQAEQTITTIANQNQPSQAQSSQINIIQQPSVTNDLSVPRETVVHANTAVSQPTSTSMPIDHSDINNERNNTVPNEQLGSGPNALLSISQEELMNATDMEPVASLPQDVDDFDNPNRVRMNVISNESGDPSDDDEEEIDDGEVEDGGTINIEFEARDLGDQQGGRTHFEVWNMPQTTPSSSSDATNEDENDEEDLESHNDEDDIDMESDNEREPQHRYSDDDEDLTSEEGDEMRVEAPPTTQTNDDEQDTDSTDDTNTDIEETAIDIHIETGRPQNTSTTGERSEIVPAGGVNNGDDVTVNVTGGDEVDDDESDLHFNEDDEEEDEDEDDEEEDESTEFEDDENDIVNYVNDIDIDDDMLSEIRNNLLSPADIEPILIPTNLQGVRIRTTAYPSIHGLTDSSPDPALPPPPMSVPALHPLLVHHSDNQLSSGAFARFRQLGTSNAAATTHLTQQQANQASFGTGATQAPTIAATAASILTGAAALAAQQQPPRNRTTRTLFVPTTGGAGVLGRASGFAEYLQQVGQIDVDPFAPSGATTTRILLGTNGHDPETWRFLHDQILMDMAPQANEGNENIDGTKIYMIRTPLARWMEESLVLDGPYVHDTVSALKPKILEPLEKTHEAETQQALAKKQKEEEEKKKRAEEKAASIASALAAEIQASANEITTSLTDTTTAQTTEVETETRPTATDDMQSPPAVTVQPEVQHTVMYDPLIVLTPIPFSPEPETVISNDILATTTASPVESMATNQPSPSAQNPIIVLDVVPDSDPVTTDNTPSVPTTTEQTSLMEVNPVVPSEDSSKITSHSPVGVSDTTTTAATTMSIAPTVVPQEEPEVEW